MTRKVHVYPVLFALALPACPPEKEHPEQNSAGSEENRRSGAGEDRKSLQELSGAERGRPRPEADTGNTQQDAERHERDAKPEAPAGGR